MPSETVKKTVTQVREYTNLEAARLDKYQILNFERALENRNPKPPTSLKLKPLSAELVESRDVRVPSRLTIEIEIEGPENHIDGWMAEVEKMNSHKEDRHGSHDVGAAYLARKKANENK